ncbi:MAG: hypothetical protein ABL903_12505 [Methylococcales bacterium]
MYSITLKKRILTAVAFPVLLCSVIANSAAENPHLVSKNIKATACNSCHVVEPENSTVDLLETKNTHTDLTKFTQDGIAMCSTCHNPDDGHKVNLKLDFEIPADMPVGKKNTISCLTCHYTHGNLSSNRPQASFSFMDRLVDAERLHKSFLLRRNNTDGELCLICHSVNEGSK